MTNILSFDIEEWYIEKHFKGGRKEKYSQYDEILDWILSTLDHKGIKDPYIDRITAFLAGRNSLLCLEVYCGNAVYQKLWTAS